jgi:hypothetical protein
MGLPVRAELLWWLLVAGRAPEGRSRVCPTTRMGVDRMASWRSVGSWSARRGR